MKNKLIYYGGSGFMGLWEKGKYLVKSKDKEVEFTSLEKAQNYYDNIQGEKAFWDLKSMDLIDCYVFKE